MSTVRVGLVQMRSGVDVDDNIEAASRLIREAAGDGARFILTPEMTSLLDRAPGALLAKSFSEADDPALSVFRELAREVGAHLSIGSLSILAGDGKCYNRSFLIDPEGAIRARYDKIHLFDVQLNAANVWRESDSFQAGTKSVVATVGPALVGLSICYDVRFPELYAQLALAGAQILAVPAAFTRITGEAHWTTLLRARAIETGCYVLAPAQGGRHEDGRETFGHSMIISPWGEVLAEAGSEPGVLVRDIDLAAVEAARSRLPNLSHRRPIAGPVIIS
jgi:predicted amidohydrolase